MKGKRTDDAVLDAAVQMLKENPTMSIVEVAQHVNTTSRTLYRHLGPQGKRKPPRGPLYSREQMIAVLKEFAEANGRSPFSYDFHRGQKINHMCYYREFGSWDAALEAAGLEPIRWREVGLPAKMRLTFADLKQKEII